MFAKDDGSIVVVGYTDDSNGGIVDLARYNPNGSLDSSFSEDGKQMIPLGTNFIGTAAAIQQDEKIIIVGLDYGLRNYDFVAARFKEDGNLDSSFSNDGKQITDLGDNDYASAITVQIDGKILVAGGASNGTQVNFAIVRYNKDGTLDSTFSTDGKQMTDFGAAGTINAIAIQNNNKIIAGGYISEDFAIAQYNADGSLDNTFGNNGRQITDFGFREYCSAIAVQQDGKIVAAGTAHNQHNSNLALARYNPNGSLDNTFSEDGTKVDYYGSGISLLRGSAIQKDGKVVVVGTGYDGTTDKLSVARYLPNGLLDNSFSNNGTYVANFSSNGYAIAVQSDGKIVAGGYAPGKNGSEFLIIRFRTDGSLDSSFSSDGKLTISFGTYSICFAIALQQDDKILVAGQTYNGSNYDFALARLNSDGSLDNSFSGDGKQTTNFGYQEHLKSIAVEADGKIIVVGYTFNSNKNILTLVRYNKDGSLDNSFSNGIKEGTDLNIVNAVYPMAIQPDGRIIVAGTTNNGINDDFIIGQYKVSGVLDSAFGKNGIQVSDFGANEVGNSICIDNSGNLLITGERYTNYTVDGDFAIARYSSSGVLDSSFTNNGIKITDFSADEHGLAATLKDDTLYVAGIIMELGNTNGIIASYLLNNTDTVWWYRDADGDGWGDPKVSKLAATQPRGYVSNTLDCNDKNKTKGGPEICDGIDNDCDGLVDEGFDQNTFYSDYDGDGYGSPKRTRQACAAPPRYVAIAGDLNDDNPKVYPGAPELCDGLDNDCNGKIDDGLPQKPFYWDHDKDGYGFRRPVYACAAPPGYITVGGDFNDNDTSIHPGAVEHCDGIDEDCDGIIDNGFAQKRFYKDRDGDGWGSNSNLIAGCAPPGYVNRNGDCNDYDANVHPEAAEVPDNGIDDNCNGEVDEVRAVVTKNESIGIKEAVVTDLQLVVTPNPSTHYFNIRVKSNSSKLAQLRMVDAVGRVIEVRQGVTPNSTISLGQQYYPGSYFVQVTQGDKHASVQLVKQVP